MFGKLARLFAKSVVPKMLHDDVGSLELEKGSYLRATQTMDAAELLALHPPQIEHAKKQLLFDIALSGV